MVHASKEFALVIALWGECHFYNKEQLCEKLGIPGQDFIILVPTNKLESQCLVELHRFHYPDDLGELKFIKLPRPTIDSFTFPAELADCFRPEIRDIIALKRRFPAPRTLDQHQLIDLFKEKDTLEFGDANEPLCVSGFDSSTFEAFIEMPKFLLTCENASTIVRGFNRFLVFAHLSITAINCPKSMLVDSFFPWHRRTLCFQSDAAFSLTISRSDFFVEPGFFFREMRDRAQTRYIWPDGTTLIFTEVNPQLKEIEFLESKPFLEHLQEYIPSGMTLEFKGKMDVSTLENGALFLTARRSASFILEFKLFT